MINVVPALVPKSMFQQIFAQGKTGLRIFTNRTENGWCWQRCCSRKRNADVGLFTVPSIFIL